MCMCHRRNLGTGLTDAAARVIGSSLTSLQRLNISRCSELGVGRHACIMLRCFLNSFHFN